MILSTALAISSKEIFMSGSNPHMRSASRAPTLTPIAGPYSGSYHSKGDEIVRKIKFSTTAGNYFGSKKETIAGSSTSVVQEQSFKNFSDDVSSLDLAETMHIKGAIEVKYSAASSSRDVVLLVEEEKTKRICLKEEVLTKCSIGASAAVTRSAKLCFTSKRFAAVHKISAHPGRSNSVFESDWRKYMSVMLFILAVSKDDYYGNI